MTLTVPRSCSDTGVFYLVGIALLAMLAAFGYWIVFALSAIRYPFELNYGEGIVWQQMALIPGARMYGDITQFPFLVFHYPPVYHLVVKAVWKLGLDPLLAGRIVSFLSSIAIACLIGFLAYHASCRAGGRVPAAIAGCTAALSISYFDPVIEWSVIMRVDMLANMLCLLGVAFALLRSAGTWTSYIAATAFVVALFTKQTSIAAPISVLLVSSVIDRKTAFHASLFAAVIAIVALTILEWSISGGFLRHILLYNINRFDLRAIYWCLAQQIPQAGFVILAFTGIYLCWRPHFATGFPGMWRRLKVMIARDKAIQAQTTLTAYFVLASVMLITLGKSGGSKNYLIEWICIVCIWSGIAVAHGNPRSSRNSAASNCGMKIF